MAWTGAPDDLADWLACNDQAIVERQQQARRATIAHIGDIA